MRIYFLLLLGVLLAGCEGGTSASSDSATPQNPSTPVAEIFVFGDRMSAGYGVTTSYVDLIEADTGLPVTNHARSDLDIVNNTLLIGSLSEVGPEDTIIISFGYQEVRWFGTVPGSVFPSFVTPFLNAAYLTGAQVYVVNPIRMNAAAYLAFPPNYIDGSDLEMQAMSDAIEAEVLAFGTSQVAFIDVQSVFNPIAANLQPDLEFPNETGHAILADTILTAMGF